jgi:surface protein
MFDDSDFSGELDLSNFDTSNVIDMSYMFNSCGNVNSFNLSSFNTSKVTNMSYMFVGITLNLKSLDLSNFDTSNVTNMSYMFAACGSLSDLDISSFNTSKVSNMSYMFNNCGALTSMDISHFDTSKVTNMGSMFNGCNRMEELIGFSATNKAGLTIGFPKGTTSSRYALKRLTFRTDLPSGTYSIRSAINVSYCAFDKAGMVEMFNSLPDITGAGVSANYSKITITGNPCLTDGTLTDDDRAIATAKGWTLVE